MQRKRGELVPIGKPPAAWMPVRCKRSAKPRPRRGTTSPKPIK